MACGLSAGEVVGRIGEGLLVFVGVGPADTDGVARDLARRVAELRIFRDEDVIAIVDRAGMAMVFTGRRHFRH